MTCECADRGVCPRCALRMWTIYDRPEDFPDHVVVRVIWVKAGEMYGERVAIVVNSVAEARAAIAFAAQVRGGPFPDSRLPRHPDDVASIVEQWV